VGVRAPPLRLTLSISELRGCRRTTTDGRGWPLSLCRRVAACDVLLPRFLDRGRASTGTQPLGARLAPGTFIHSLDFRQHRVAAHRARSSPCLSICTRSHAAKSRRSALVRGRPHRCKETRLASRSAAAKAPRPIVSFFRVTDRSRHACKRVRARLEDLFICGT
jgi:hypothetical protein